MVESVRIVGTPAERLRHALALRAKAEAAEAQAIADLAAEHDWDADAEFDVHGERPVRIDADGVPLFGEFLPLEIAALKRISVSAATWLIRDLVILRHRHPLWWSAAQAGRVPVFRACQLAVEVARWNLTIAQAHAVDALVADCLGVMSWRRVLERTRAAIIEVAPDAVREATARARSEKFCRRHTTDEPTIGLITARVDTADAIAFDEMVDRIADLLGVQGDDAPKDHRRASALGVLAAPGRACALLAEAEGRPAPVRATDPRLLPRARIYVHLHDEQLATGEGPVRIEDLGALHVRQLAELVGHSRIKLTPVVHLSGASEEAVDAYEIPRRIRRRVILRDRHEVFPYSGRSARRQDLDHTIPYEPGVRGQTRPSNLGPLSRKAHRAKTVGRWHLDQPRPGIFWWRSPVGNRYRVGADGTRRITEDFSSVEAELSWHLDRWSERSRPQPP